MSTILTLSSGRFTSAPLWGTGDTIQRTLDIIETLSQWVLQLETDNTTSGTIVGVELMNEAATWKLPNIGINDVKNYYLAAYPIVRKYLPGGISPNFVNFQPIDLLW
jgi:hypothetical protein